ncbi:hypothetical protein Bhyg_12550 [Pseudolycoriella hygida]|uniref:Uncharacterized protein n=1 Tax=Pseudolycoriella hygida TaxID=35572 RepID=A0A9Q0MXK4_9DIPT|nr:hypothetical protein Bhyg_12550 [Pseudolycoriella hygida]
MRSVVCLTAISGTCRTHELPQITVADVKKYDDVYIVHCLETKTKEKRTFTISGPFISYVEKYAALRPKNCSEKRFFLNYQKGDVLMCTSFEGFTPTSYKRHDLGESRDYNDGCTNLAAVKQTFGFGSPTEESLDDDEYFSMTGHTQTFDKPRDESRDYDDNYSMAELTQTFDKPRDESCDDDDYFSMAGLTQTYDNPLDETRDDDYVSMAGITQTLVRVGDRGKLRDRIKVGDRVKVGDSVKVSDRDDVSLSVIGKKQDTSNIGHPKYLELLEKTFTFYKCENLTIKFSP